MSRVAIALILLPPTLYALLASGAAIFGVKNAIASAMDIIGFGAWFALLTYFFMGAVSVPALLVCMWCRWHRLWHAIVVGCVTGFAAIAGTAIPQLFDDRLHLAYRLSQMLNSGQFVLLGGLAGALFWLMAFWRNPRIRTARSQQAATGASSAA